MSHALLSPSSAVRWLRCPGSVALSEGIEQRTSPAAARGTVGHELVEMVLTGRCSGDPLRPFTRELEGITVEVDADLIAAVEQCVAEGRTALEGADAFWFEVKVPLESLTREPDATGTADMLIAKGRRLEVHDWKFGYHEVTAERNPQMMIYALGAMEMLAPVADFDEALLVIHQPGHGAPKEWLVSVHELREFAADVTVAADAVRGAVLAHKAGQAIGLHPSNDGCRFCPARATCPALRAEVDAAVLQELTAVSDGGLGEAMSKVERVEAWCKEVRAEVERRLLDGKPVAGWKLVQGRRGARKWADEKMAEALLIEVLGEHAYEKSLVSPSTAEKTVKKEYPEAWATMTGFVTQSDGKPSVAPASDKREAINPADASADFVVIN